MKLFLSFLFALITTLAFTTATFAEGGKRGQPDLGSITTGDGCVFAVPQSIDTDNCEEVFQDPQSGVTTWVCADETYVATCPPLGEEPPGNSGNNAGKK